MPLSEHEQRQLEQIEQALRADDPRFARRMTGITTERVPAKDRQAGKQAGTGLMARLEERWRRRQGGGR